MRIKLNRRQLRIVVPIASILIITAGTYLAIQIGKGYRPTTQGLAGTGLLAANSFPPGAEVYLNDKLTTATDDTLNLTPGEYNVTIRKEGYVPWSKHLDIKQELVTQTNATLFRAVPSLSPLTLSGATNITPSPDGLKIAYAVASASAQAKNGLYILELTSTPLSLQQGPRQIAKNTADFNFAQSRLLWSPNSSQLLAHFDNQGETSNFILDPRNMNDLENLPDATYRLPSVLSEWEEDIVLRETKQFALLPPQLQHIATASATNIYFSPNEERVMYTATAAALLTPGLIPTPAVTSTQPEERRLEPGGVYIYDLVEDKNFKIHTVPDLKKLTRKPLLLQSDYGLPNQTSLNQNSELFLTRFDRLQVEGDVDATMDNFQSHYSSMHLTNIQWYPNSTHLLVNIDDQVEIVEYDNTNRTTVFSGPLEHNFVYPWPDGTKLILPLNLNPGSSASINLYAVDIR